MKTARIINAAVWVAGGVMATSMVCFNWETQGCWWQSIAVAVVEYTSMFAIFGVLIDKSIKERK